METVLGGDGLGADARLGEGDVLGDLRVEVVADHEHVEMLVDGVDREGARGVGRGREDVGFAADADDVGRVAAAGALGVEGVDRAALEGAQGVVDVAGLVERVGVDGDLDVEFVGDAEAGVDRGGGGAPVLVEFEADGAGKDLLAKWFLGGAVALAEETEVHRERLGRLEHAVHVPRARRAGGGERAVRGAGAAAEHGGDAGADGLVDLLRADEMDVRVDAAGGDDAALARDRLGAGADDHRVLLLRGGVGVDRADARLDTGVARVADADDAAVLDADVGLDDAEERIEDEGVGDDEVERLGVGRGGRLAHAVADDLAAAELHLVAVAGGLGDEVALDLDEELGVGEADAVAGSGAEHLGVLAAGKMERHGGRSGARGCGEWTVDGVDCLDAVDEVDGGSS